MPDALHVLQTTRSVRRRLDFERPVERAVLNALGVNRFDFRITGPRQRITPPRHEQWNPIRREHERNLQAAGLPVRV